MGFETEEAAGVPLFQYSTISKPPVFYCCCWLGKATKNHAASVAVRSWRRQWDYMTRQERPRTSNTDRSGASGALSSKGGAYVLPTSAYFAPAVRW